MLEIFENYSVANPDCKIKPIESNLSINELLIILENHFKTQEYNNIFIDNNFCEIYAKKNGFEVSLQLIQSKQGSLINASVYGRNKRGKTRKYLKQLLTDIKNIIK